MLWVAECGGDNHIKKSPADNFASDLFKRVFIYRVDYFNTTFSV